LISISHRRRGSPSILDIAYHIVLSGGVGTDYNVMESEKAKASCQVKYPTSEVKRVEWN
jgi:hypothetical protein